MYCIYVFMYCLYIYIWYICIHRCIYIWYICIHRCIYIYICIYVLHICIYVLLIYIYDIFVYIDVYIYIHMYLCIAYMYLCIAYIYIYDIFVYIDVYIYIYIYIYIYVLRVVNRSATWIHFPVGLAGTSNGTALHQHDDHALETRMSRQYPGAAGDLGCLQPQLLGVTGKISSFLKNDPPIQRSVGFKQNRQTPRWLLVGIELNFACFLSSWHFWYVFLPSSSLSNFVQWAVYGSFLRLNSHFALLLGKVLEAESAWWVLPSSWHCESGGCNLRG